MSAAPHLAVLVPHLRQGGGELSMLRLAAALARSGLRVDLLVHTLAGAEVAVPAGLNVVQLGGGEALGTLSSLRHLARWLRVHRPRWLLSAFPHTNVAAVAAASWARCGCQVVVSEHAPLSLQIQRQGQLGGGWRYRVLPPLVRWAYRRAAAVVAVSQGVRDDLHQLVGPGLQVHTIANPVLDAAVAAHPPGDGPGAPGAAQRWRGLPVLHHGAQAGQGAQLGQGAQVGTPLHPWLTDPSLAVVLSVCRLSEEKGLPLLLQAFATLHAQRPHTRLVLAGDGPLRKPLQRQVQALGLQAVVALPGRIEAPRHWMQRAAVFALASSYEGFGNVLVEALSCGTAVVSTDCPVGPREILDGGRFGALVPVGDAEAMAAALGRAVDAPGAPAGALAHAWQFTDAAACAAYCRLLFALGAPAALSSAAQGPEELPAAPLQPPPVGAAGVKRRRPC
jgi:glycosyltransferase involved in cell wall biosynthesis